MQIMPSSERPEFEPLFFPLQAATGSSRDAVTPEVVAAIERLARSIALLAETLSRDGVPNGGLQNALPAADADFSFLGI
jgi:hypothetical protein